MASILIVEDDPTLSEMYQEKFKMAGYEVTCAFSGKEGLGSLKKKKADIILLDILMPEINGFEMLKKMKMDRKLREIPVILLTNLGESKIDMDSDLTRALGVKGYLIKTKHTPDDVLAKVKAALKLK